MKEGGSKLLNSRGVCNGKLCCYMLTRKNKCHVNFTLLYIKWQARTKNQKPEELWDPLCVITPFQTSSYKVKYGSRWTKNHWLVGQIQDNNNFVIFH